MRVPRSKWWPPCIARRTISLLPRNRGRLPTERLATRCTIPLARIATLFSGTLLHIGRHPKKEWNVTLLLRKKATTLVPDWKLLPNACLSTPRHRVMARLVPALQAGISLRLVQKWRVEVINGRENALILISPSDLTTARQLAKVYRCPLTSSFTQKCRELRTTLRSVGVRVPTSLWTT